MSSSTLTSADKKRLRDRRAQQALRSKKQQYTAQLEDKVAHCERYHDDSSTQHLMRVIEGLQRENEMLRRRQEGLKALVESWEELDLNPPPPLRHPITPSLLFLTLPPTTITTCPPSPNPLDLLYGTNTNPLAHAIYTHSLRRPLRDPERLAFGWLSYHYAKWLFDPSPSTFSHLPIFLHPVPEQLSIPHPASLDLLIWPEIRVNLIREWGSYTGQKDDLFGFLACCLKVRWPWGEPVLERDKGNELVVREEFLERFMCVNGWGITREFVGVYPGVVRGVDVGRVLVEVG
ncbi:hypothetical protein BO94DRAFT_566006 [Aspergillus sclerotioniger CBS 115572]|uniref:BZIP domain-containing protein n=1 Tax=Aspergillus sclerotioniger CBS 115572 TaxID=1450535 RepID=A0A317WSE4_9EURO|nr:hypothetical protein BO94DRAFT_566006 [Aspergillus sclerotioniger CBS 115572]PWY87120.1 hypothetical protein BO94DRAFT_566006 [Aspergillus sclerotioniger CBS 115572]